MRQQGGGIVNHRPFGDAMCADRDHRPVQVEREIDVVDHQISDHVNVRDPRGNLVGADKVDAHHLLRGVEQLLHLDHGGVEAFDQPDLHVQPCGADQFADRL